MKTVYLILDSKKKPSRVSLVKPRIDPKTGLLNLKPGETFQPIKLSPRQSIAMWTQ